jgi:hypothetical protein
LTHEAQDSFKFTIRDRAIATRTAESAPRGGANSKKKVTNPKNLVLVTDPP